MHAFFSFLQFSEQGLLWFGEVVHESNHLRLDRLFGGVSCSPVHDFNQFVGTREEMSCLAADEVITSSRGVVLRSAGESEQFAIIIDGHLRGDEASAFLFGLRHDDGIRESCHYTVALHKERCEGFDAGHMFGQQAA